MAISAPAFVNQDEIKAAVVRVEKTFSPQVVRIGYSFAEDHLDAPAVFFRILVRDEAAAMPTLGDLGLRIPTALMNEARTHENGLHAYFDFRSLSEQQKLRDPLWD